MHTWTVLLGPNSSYIQLYHRISSSRTTKQAENRWFTSNWNVNPLQWHPTDCLWPDRANKMMLCYSERQRRAFTIGSTKDFKLEHLGVLFVISPSGAHVKVITTPTIWANDLISTWRAIIALHHRIVSNWHAPLVAIGQEQWAQHRDKGPSTSSSKSTIENMNMVNRLYKASEKINQWTLYEHIIKLLDHSTTDMDDDIKRAHRPTIKNDQTIKTRRER